MRIIIPMAGMGKRMRPHTLTIPKPLIPIAGKPIVQRLVEEIAKLTKEKISDIAFVISGFEQEVEKSLKKIAESIGAASKIYYQKQALGTAHAIYCAEEFLHGKVIVAYADTLFKADFVLDDAANDGIIWVHKVNNPGDFGVVKVNKNNIITDFIEKPKEFVSNLAIIGIYYFPDGNILKKELKYLIANNIIVDGEYQITDALKNMQKKGINFIPGKVQQWLDCGNKDATVYTNQRILKDNDTEKLISESAKINNSIIIAPCYIGENVKIENSVIGPYLSVGNNTVIKNSLIKNSIILCNSIIESLNIQNSMLGNYVALKGEVSELSIGDYTTISK